MNDSKNLSAASEETASTDKKLTLRKTPIKNLKSIVRTGIKAGFSMPPGPINAIGLGSIR